MTAATISDSLSDSLSRRAALLEAVADARQAEHAAMISGTEQQKFTAGWAVANAEGAVDDHDDQLIAAVLLGLRLAALRVPEALSGALSDIPLDALNARFAGWENTVDDHQKRIANLEKAVVAIAKGKAVAK